MPEKSTPRRSPDPSARQRDGERSRRLLMQAAVAEFSARGFEGARVGDIAARAGLNKQLISYYFGGKQGLYDAISEQWRHEEEQFAGPQLALPDLVEAYVRRAMAYPELARLVVREGLDGAGGTAENDAAQRQRFARVLADMQRRQRAGELAADLDPASVALALFAMCAALVSFPHLARAMDLEPDDAEVHHRYATEVARLVARLAAPAT